MINDRDPNVFSYSPGTASSGTSTIVPQQQTQQTTANLGIGGSINFDFTGADTQAIFDMFVFADQALQILVYIRQGSTDTYRLLDSDINAGVFANGVANALKRVLKGERFPGSNVRITLKNASGVATTVLSAQVRASSL